MKNVITSIFLLIATLTFSQKNIYESPKFDNLSKDHKVLAILPFFTHLDLEKSISKEEKKILEQKEGYAVQDALEIYFSKRKKKKKFSVEFQNTKNTNAILAQNDINYGNIDIYSIKELCKILNVDGIISGNIDLNVLLSDGIASDFSFIDYILVDADYGRIGIKISDGETSKLLWRYEKKINKKSGKNTQDLIELMMKQATKKFPYDRESLKSRKGN
ncbi:hypothetical protein H0I23_02505 [Cellulophaga sp. HaHaR_3_176]|uniref:hypothetical protein n=1 Tax=Cellulophaga sp. HaHaR_3_176 TaxID=1942464 RepID=UPI001C1F42DD|nr:hypothetical protein [Cellulophaga sp. HaHaR_3_176]QWX84536.1 hypothetical protein H0I23_02505 [Cellulophaga sp. HaHaR_3_176]